MRLFTRRQYEWGVMFIVSALSLLILFSGCATVRRPEPPLLGEESEYHYNFERDPCRIGGSLYGRCPRGI